MQIKMLFDEYIKNMEETQALNESLYEIKERDSWILALAHRAKRLDELFCRNNEIVSNMKEYSYTAIENTFAYRSQRLNEIVERNTEILKSLKDVVLHLDEGSIEELENGLDTMYYENYDDIEIFMSIGIPLSEYYLSVFDYDHYILAMTKVGYAQNALSRLNNDYKEDKATFLKIIALKDKYQTLTNPKARKALIAAFSALVSGINSVTPDESKVYLCELMEFIKSDEFLSIDKNNEEILSLADEAIDKWQICNLEPDYGVPSEETLNLFYEIALKRLNKEDIYSSNFMCFFSYLLCEFKMGKRSKKNIIDEGLAYYLKNLDLMNENDLSYEDLHFIFYTPAFIALFMKQEGTCDINTPLSTIKKTLSKWSRESIIEQQSLLVKEILADWIYSSLPLEENQEVMERRVFNTIVKSQAPTYIHSVMVSRLACTIYDYMDKSLFPEMENRRDFVKKSALFHDVGKISMADIINLQTRKLSDLEFMAIKNHPRESARLLDENPLLSKYHDISLGHHKWYNGKGGYPLDFDNTKSPYRIFIDLITIADCLDAATDSFGRNYKRKKTVSEVIQEFKKDSGTRYNPDIVDTLVNNPTLIEELTEITETKRLSLMFEAYTEIKIEE